jgi:L-fuculose-phosphate aldolase
MSEAIQAMRLKITQIGNLLFERHLTDAAGGNVSARVDDLICITSRFSGTKYRWNLQPNQVLVTDLSGNKFEGDGDISRESKVHYHIFQNFPDVGAVVHCHAQNALVFASAQHPIVPVLEDTMKFGVIKVCDYAPAHSMVLAESIVNLLKGQEERIRKQAAAVLAPWHGLFVAGKDLDAAFDAAERIDTNAHCILFSKLLPIDPPVNPNDIMGKITGAMQEFS